MIEFEGTPQEPTDAAPEGGPRAGGRFVIEGPIDRDDIPALCARVARVIAEATDAGDDRDIVCQLGPTIMPTDVTVEALARLQLTAIRLGRRLRLGPCCPTLRTLLHRIGFSEVFPDAAATDGSTNPLA